MTGCDWCNKPIRFWQRRFEGWLYLEHAACHAERVQSFRDAWMALPERIKAEQRRDRWYLDLVRDGLIPHDEDRLR